MLPLRSTDLGTQDRARLPPYEAALLRQDPTRWPGDDTQCHRLGFHTQGTPKLFQSQGHYPGVSHPRANLHVQRLLCLHYLFF